MQRASESNEVAQAIVWLMSDKGKFTPQVLLDVSGR
jgi:hypothetical protein